MSEAILSMSAGELRNAYARKELSPPDVVEAVLRQIERMESQLNTFAIRASVDDLHKAAAESAKRWMKGEPLGPLDGIPITIKDAIRTKGWPTLAGSHTVNPDQPWTEDSPAVARARESGAVFLGKTTTPEFGWKAVTDSPKYGITRNPWNLDRTPGGSSGGSAAALAAGIGHAAIGTDAAGSVRIPAAFCGLVALKATTGRIPTYPPSALWRMGHIGPICRTVDDAAMMLQLMAQPDARDWSALPVTGEDFQATLPSLKGLRIAYSPTLGYAKVDPEIARIVDAAVLLLVDAGANIEQVEAPFPDPTPGAMTMFVAGIAHSQRHLDEEALQKLDPALRDVIRRSDSLDRTAYMSAVDSQIALTRNNRLFHQTYDILLTPTLSVAAFEVGKNVPDGYDSVNWMSWTPFTYPFNITGQPAATVPCGLTAEGLPVGLQVVGDLYADARVLQVARIFEGLSPFQRALPPCLKSA